MKHLTTGLLTIIVLLSTVDDAFGQRRRGGAHATDQLSQANGWLSNYQTALQEAEATNKPLMLVFRCVP